MKKSIFSVIFSIYLFSLSAQNSYHLSNRNTARRSLKLTGNWFMRGDWNNAMRKKHPKVFFLNCQQT